MSALKLDRTKGFAQIFGDTEGRAYQQGEHHFRVDGSLWRDPKKKETAEEKAAREKDEAEAAAAEAAARIEAEKEAAAGGADDQLSKQLNTGSVGGAA